MIATPVCSTEVLAGIISDDGFGGIPGEGFVLLEVNNQWHIEL